MTKQLVEVITSVERRRRWSREEKERLVAATFEPGASVSEIARSAGIHSGQLFRWRKELCLVSAPSVSQYIPRPCQRLMLWKRPRRRGRARRRAS
ncbi:transposase [Rhizobium gallicum]|uniref:transposase n=1 Tax=Rhizobium gallicum TaxID=56730 RepID=UPI001EF776F4|nr:transposase [Rhizobium gallicum]ULJ72361.1 transposase [Rhizobium gallicum]